MPFDLTLKRETADTGFVTNTNFARRLTHDAFDHACDVAFGVRDCPLDRIVLSRQDHRDFVLSFVCVQCDVRGTIFHDRLLSYAALMPLALTRDLRWDHPTVTILHYRRNLRPRSRSFHMVYRLPTTGHRLLRQLEIVNRKL